MHSGQGSFGLCQGTVTLEKGLVGSLFPILEGAGAEAERIFGSAEPGFPFGQSGFPPFQAAFPGIQGGGALFEEEHKSPNVALKSHGLAENADLRKFLAGISKRFKLGVFGKEEELMGNGVILDALQGGFVTDEHSGNLSVFNLLLLPDKDDITVTYTGPDHRIAPGAQTKVSGNICACFHIEGFVFVGKNGSAAGNIPEQGEAPGLNAEEIIHLDLIFPAHQISGRCMQNAGKIGNLVTAHIGNHAIFPFTHSAFPDADSVSNLLQRKPMFFAKSFDFLPHS